MAGGGSELLKSSELNLWTRVKLQECYHEVSQEDDQREPIVLADHAEEHGFLEADQRASPRAGRVTLSSYVCPRCH